MQRWDEHYLTDSHCHVSHLEDRGAYDRTLQRAHTAGVKNFVWVSTDYPDFKKTQERVGDMAWAVSLGVHPHEAKGYKTQDWETFFESETYLAVGECGLDYFYNHSDPKIQMEVFDHQLSMGAKYKKPVIVHIRDAFEDALPRCEAAAKKGVKGVVHCFSGNKSQAKKIVDMGWFAGFTGIITFQKKVDDLLAALSYIPKDHVLLETDSPYLAPLPHRGKPNEPSYLSLVAEKAAQIKGMSLEEITKITTLNANRLFLET
jgi:TatD DNase family protein